jgi:hypothetical protein
MLTICAAPPRKIPIYLNTIVSRNNENYNGYYRKV